jgi:hypothetical protein
MMSTDPAPLPGLDASSTTAAAELVSRYSELHHPIAANDDLGEQRVSLISSKSAKAIAARANKNIAPSHFIGFAFASDFGGNMPMWHLELRFRRHRRECLFNRTEA